MGDLGRIERQQKFIKAFVERLKTLKQLRFENLKVIGRLPSFMLGLYNDVDTDMSSDLFLRLMAGFSKIERMIFHLRHFLDRANTLQISLKEKLITTSVPKNS